MRQSTPTWRHFNRPASISCAMNKCEVFKNLAASIVDKFCFSIGEGGAEAFFDTSIFAGEGDASGDGGDVRDGESTDVLTGEGSSAGARIGIESPSSRKPGCPGKVVLVAWGGIEPPTRGFSIRCSTN